MNVVYGTKKLLTTLLFFGMIPHDEKPLCSYNETYSVMLDGSILGRVYETEAQEFCDKLRAYKINAEHSEVSCTPCTH